MALTAIDSLANIGIAKYASKKGLTSFAPMQNSVQEVVALALSVLILSFVPQDKLLDCTLTVGGLMAFLLGFQVLSNLIGSTNPPDEDVVTKLGNVAIKIGIMGLLMSAGLSMLKDMDTGLLATAEGGIAIILLIFGGIAKFTKADDAVKTASALVIAAASVVELCLGFSLLEGMNPLTLAIAKDAVEGILVILGLILAAGSEIGKVGPMLATGGALAIASAGVIEICVGLKQLENMNAIQIAVATEGIKGIVAIIGIVNAVSGSINKVGPLLASGGAFAIASAGVIEICVGLKQLENMNAIQIAVATEGIKGIVAIIGIINTVSGNISKVGPLLASGGAFAIASAGVIEICMGLQQLQGISAIEMVIYTQSIKELVAIIGIVNTVSGCIGEVGPLLASGGAFAIASFGIIEICFALQQLQGMSAIQIKWATDAIKELVAIIGVINMVSGTVAQVGPLLASGGAFAIAAAGVIEICIGLKQLEGLDPSTIKTGAEAIDSIIVVLGAVGAFLSLPIFAEGAVTLVAIAASVYMIAEGFKAFAEGIRLWLELAKDLPQLLREAKEGLEEVGKMIERWWNDMLGPELAKAIENFKKWWNETAIPAIKEFFANLPETLGKALEGIVNWAVNDAWPVIQDLFGKLAEGIGKFIEENLPKLGKAIQDAWESFTKWLGEKWAGIVKFFTEDIPKALGDLGTSIGKFFSDLHENIGKWFKEKWDAFVKWLTEDVPKWWGEQYDKVKEKLSKTWENLTTGIGKKFKEWVKETKAWWKEKWDKLLTWLGELPTKILEGIGDLVETGKNIVGGIIEGMKKAVTDNAVTRAISDVGKTISDGINGFFGVNSPSKLMRDTVGKAIPEGIGVGMTKYSKLLRKPTIKMGRSTLKSITDFFEIHSPSRLMRDKVGRYIPEGIAAGLDAYAITAVDSAEALGSSISQAVYSGLGDISGSQYGYGISPVLDIETLKTDIEVLHEMLRIKIDEVTDLLHQKIDETLQAFEEFILEQLEAKMETDDEIFLTRLEDIKTYVEEKLSGLYEKLEGLNTSITEGLNQSIPQITEQVMSGFESVSQSIGTVGQSVSSILEALNDEQKKAVDDAITGTIVEKLEAISAALGTDVGQYAEWAHGHSNSVIDTAGKPFGILDWLVTMFDEDNFFRSIYEPTRRSIVEVIGTKERSSGDDADIYSLLNCIDDSVWMDDVGVATMINDLVGGIGKSLFGSYTDPPNEPLYDITKSIEDALYVDAGTSASVAQFLDDVSKNQNTLQTYLEKILGSVDEGKGTLVDQLKATEDNGTKLDDVGQKVEEAGDKVATDYSAMKEKYENHYSTYEVQQMIDRMMGTAITEEGRQSLAQGEIAFVDGQKYVM